MPIVDAVIVLANGPSSGLPATAAGIAAALNVPVADIKVGIPFFCTDTGNFYVWNGTVMVQIGGGGGAVASVFGRTGAVTASAGDYSSFYDAAGAAATALSLAESFATSAVATETSRAEAAEALLAPSASPTFTGTVSGITYSMVGADASGAAATAQANAESFATSAVAAETTRAEAAEALLAAPSGTANEIYATPNGSSGVASLRHLVAADIPGSIPNTKLANSSITVDGDGTIFSATAPGAIALGASGSLSLNTQSANTVFAGPVSGTAAAPTVRGLVSADLPNYVSAATKGFFWGGFLTTPIAAPTGAAPFTLVRAMQFVLPYAVTVRKITANLVTGVSTTGLASFGIYDVNGNLLIDSGQFTCGTANVGLVQSVLGTTGGSSAVTTLPAGVYYFAWIGNSTTISFTGSGGLNNTTTTSIFNFGATTSTAEVRLGHSANGYSGTALPGTLGTLTGESGETVPYVLFES